jgi:ATP-dependent protease ClpP protease subunit
MAMRRRSSVTMMLRGGVGAAGGTKRQRVVAADADSDTESSAESVLLGAYTHNNHVYFSGDVTPGSMFLLCKELRSAAHTLRARGCALPIYLHVTTDGGDVSSAFACVDCIKTLGTPVYSVVEGFVASAGTLITLAAAKRFIGGNAYMMIHQVSSGVWGKMNSIKTQFENLTKLMDHLVQFYKQHAKMSKTALSQLLSTDVELNSTECIARGLADAVYQGDVLLCAA